MTNIQTTPQMMKDEGIALKQIQESETVSAPNTAFRYGAAMPLAAIATVGLMISMVALIATEFTPQDKLETTSFEINPRNDDIPDPIRTIRLDPLREVEVPPPPPTTGFVETNPVEQPVIKVVGRKIDFVPTDMTFNDFDTIQIDKDPTPLLRIPPVFPSRFLQGDESGYCRVKFDVNPEGRPFNIATTVCTNKQLKSATVKSVQKWKYAPEMQNGRPVSRSGLETVIRFDLRGDRGELLPLPVGF